jgi:hypothetical protein
MQQSASGVPVLETFKPKSAGYQVSMPSPRDEIATEDIMKRQYTYKHVEGSYTLTSGIAHGSLMGPQQTQAGLDGLCDDLVKSLKGTVTSSKPVEYIGSSGSSTIRVGKEVEGTTTTDGAEAFRFRIYLIGNNAGKTAYTLLVTGKKSFVDSSEASSFISSLKVLD